MGFCDVHDRWQRLIFLLEVDGENRRNHSGKMVRSLPQFIFPISYGKRQQVKSGFIRFRVKLSTTPNTIFSDLLSPEEILLILWGECELAFAINTTAFHFISPPLRSVSVGSTQVTTSCFNLECSRKPFAWFGSKSSRGPTWLHPKLLREENCSPCRIILQHLSFIASEPIKA